MSILVKIRVQDEQLNFIRRPVLASGDQNVVRCKFCFNDAWDGFTKTATFTQNNTTPVAVPIVDDECVIPYTVISCKCKLYIGVIGVKDGKRITTHLLLYDIVKGINDSSVVLPTAEQLNLIIKNYCDTQNFATKTYVDEHQCDCDTVTEEFVEDAVTVGLAQLDEAPDVLGVILHGGDSDEATEYNNDDMINYIFEGGGASGNQNYPYPPTTT